MEKTRPLDKLKAHYDQEQDILYLTFTEHAREAIAEEIGDEVFVRYEPDTHAIVDIEFLNMSARLQQIFGTEMQFIESDRVGFSLLPTHL